MDEEREEESPTSKTTLSGEHGRQSKTKSPEQLERADSPGPSCVSMKSDRSMDPPEQFKDGNPSIKKRKVLHERADSPRPSCVTMKTDRSMNIPPEFKDGRPTRKDRQHQKRSKVTSAQSVQQQTELIKRAEENAHAFLDKEMKKVWRVLFPQCSESQTEEEEEEVDGKNEEQRRRAKLGVADITKLCLIEMNQKELADTVRGGSTAVQCTRNIKSHLKKKFRCMFEGIAKAGHSTPLNDFYTDLFITEGSSGEVNKEHEVRLIETASRKPAKEETPIRCEDIFQPLPDQYQPIRTILTTGVAGIGKTVLTHKFTLDWAEGKTNQDINITFLLTFRELNLMKGKEFSLVELLHYFFIETKEAGICRFDLFQVVFILDGLDECRPPLDFQNNPIWTDVTEPTSVDVLLTNLIRGNLLPSARIWITTRPAAPGSPTTTQNACELTLDPDTANRQLSLSEDNRKVTEVTEDQSYSDHPERFVSSPQVLGREALTGRCYWEVEWKGPVQIGVTYRGITRRGGNGGSWLGLNNKSWCLHCHEGGYYALYNCQRTITCLPPAGSTRVGVYLDRPTGSLSYYRVSPGGGGSSDTLTHIHTFQSSFTQEDLLPGFGLLSSGASVSLCRL